VTDWREWHGHYDRPGSALARRLVVVRRRISEALAALGERPLRIVSLCAGDGRDLLPELAISRDQHHRAVLVEKNEGLAADAKRRVSGLGLDNVVVIVGDAGEPSTFAEHLPVDLLLLCGIFGNISEHEIRVTIAAVPAMLIHGGFVVWTRGKKPGEDIRPMVRRWFVDEGLEEVAFDGDPEPFGVGVARLLTEPDQARKLPDRLFTFLR
jgi:hypothetical protein